MQKAYNRLSQRVQLNIDADKLAEDINRNSEVPTHSHWRRQVMSVSGRHEDFKVRARYSSSGYNNTIARMYWGEVREYRGDYVV